MSRRPSDRTTAMGQQQEANGMDDASTRPDATPATGAETEQAGALPETTGPPDEWIRLEPSEAEIEQWAERERERRQAWLCGPTPAERAAWRQQNRQRSRTHLDAGPPPDGARRAQPTLREAQLAAEGAASLLWRALTADRTTGPLRAWSRRGLDALVRAGREWEAEADRPCSPLRAGSTSGRARSAWYAATTSSTSSGSRRQSRIAGDQWSSAANPA
ncbi:MAG TPA: hypothetical protein VNK05_19425, partial [Chloroflexota bacterium]|nr:hypothetical protein [Chloroflexota bacterium]